MREKTNGIVLSVIAYNDKSSFVHIYTEKFGRVTYSLPNVKGKRGRLSRSLFAPFSILELDVEHLPTREIQKIAEARVLSPHTSIPFDPVKNAVVLFLAEALSRTVREQEQNLPLYHFIVDSVNLYDLLEEGKANFHLVFLLKISEFLGFRIHRESYSPGYRFDMAEGSFTPRAADHPYYLEPTQATLLHAVLLLEYGDLASFGLNREQRGFILDVLVAYFRLHLPDLKEIKSLEILKSLFG
ncbi:MAG: recombination protein O N-terminal domain-containing protein [Bacteroidales bacterium]